jgi:D-3-phosphoglycerate dehydrogenase
VTEVFEATELPSERTKNVIYEEVSNLTVYFILSHYFTDVGCFDTWSKKERDSVLNKNILIVGSKGNIGSKVKYKLQTFTDNILEYNINDTGLDELIKVADIITFHIPLTKDTKGIINKRYLDIMKKDVVLVNTSRGKIFDENDLYDDLVYRDKTCYFDVFWEEPYKGKLKDLDNIDTEMLDELSFNTYDEVETFLKLLQIQPM